MTPRTFTTSILFAFAAVSAGGCASDNASLATASVAPEKVAAAPKVDPVCVTLASQIDTLRKEGTVERLEKASSGKTANVQVKRASLAKQAELNKANADFQAKCGPQMPKAQTAQAAPAQAATAQAATAAPAPVAQAAAAPSAAQAANTVTDQAKAAAVTAAKAAAKN
jgi:hypothetical protein